MAQEIESLYKWRASRFACKAATMDAISTDRKLNFCDACAVRNRAICADLDDTEITALNMIGRRQILAAGDHLQWQGEEAVLVANIVEGVFKLSTGTSDGREQIVGLVYPSDFMGRPFGKTAEYSIEALTDSTICVFQRADFEKFALEHPRLEHKLLERTLSELDRSRRWMLLLGRMNAEQKLASFLLESADRLAPSTCSFVPDGGPKGFTLPLTRQQVADVLGLTMETVSRQFTKLRKQGLVEVHSRKDVIILDQDGLVERAGNSHL